MQSFILASGVAIFLAFMIWSEISSWNAQVLRMNSYLAQTAKAIAQHTDDVIEVAKQPLAGLAFRVQDHQKTVLESLDLVRAMRELVTKSPYLRSLAYIGPDGRLIESTIDSFSSGLDLSGRHYFTVHKLSEDQGALIDGPYKGDLSNQWFITLSQRVNDAHGRFAGVMVATIDINSFVTFFNDFNTLGEGVFVLIDGDGCILVRAPLDATAMGSSLADTTFYRDNLLKNDRGNYQYQSPYDGVEKTSGYYRSATTHITAFVAVSKKAILWRWVGNAKTRWLCSLFAVMAALAMAIRLHRQWVMRRKDEVIIAAREAEFRLIANASSDLIEKLNEHGIREYVSAASQSVLEVDADDLIGRSVLDGYDAEARQYWSEALANIAAGSSIERLIFRKQKKNGEMAWLESVVTRVGSFDVGNGMVAVTRDVTSQRLLQDELDRLANTDELTQLSNKRHFNAQMKMRTAEARAAATALSLLVIDVDKFKLFNDTYGHLPGDTCLRAIATEISASIRSGVDLAARYGGEEMAVLLPGLTESQAWDMADDIRQRIAAMGIVHQKNLPWGCVTVSIGVASLRLDQHESDEDFFIRADQSLYQAKNSGRNTVVAFHESFSRPTAVAS